MTSETPTPTASAVALPGGVITDETWDEFSAIATGALGHMVDGGETPAFLGTPMSKEEAVDHLTDWLDKHKSTLVEGGVGFLRAIVNRFALVDEPQQSIEEFEAALLSLTDEQLTVLSEQLADEAEALKKSVVDRRREMVADLLETANVLLRGALGTGVQAALARIG